VLKKYDFRFHLNISETRGESSEHSAVSAELVRIFSYPGLLTYTLH